ncbi:site-specific integrase [Sorangium sp. So ce448]|uniref:site-specific integrase n=1 Tax=Sorangium sp. So ce448 TaxID=3133314 RepID=UPI003F5F3D21
MPSLRRRLKLCRLHGRSSSTPAGRTARRTARRTTRSRIHPVRKRRGRLASRSRCLRLSASSGRARRVPMRASAGPTNRPCARRTIHMPFIEAVRATLRRLHCSPRTEEAIVHWLRQFIRFHSDKHPWQMGAEEDTAFVDELAVARRGIHAEPSAVRALLPLHAGSRPADTPARSARTRTPAGAPPLGPLAA